MKTKLSQAEIEAIENAARPTKRKIRSISLDDEQFERFQKTCDTRGVAANKVIDALIALFLASPKD